MQLNISRVLKHAREEKGISLEQASRDLKIHSKYLAALESGDFGVFASGIHLTGFLKNYSAYLGLNVDQMLAFFRRDFGSRQISPGHIKPVGVGLPILTPEKITWGAVLAIFILFFFYLFWQAHIYFEPPYLRVESPAADLHINALKIDAIGKVCADCQVKINGQSVNVGSDGSFATSVALKDGTNTLTFIATNKAGRESQVVRNVVVGP
ncbi:MAG: helix-turn-helix domain-containing protein [Patescibacteria group bacterium]|nr:helix-turn-helix domain-containing protein [Patescibacteria group bacterium]